jgi:hypothetical protein
MSTVELKSRSIAMHSISNDRYASQVRLDSTASSHHNLESEDHTNYADDKDNRLIVNFNDWIMRYGAKKGLKYDTFTDIHGVLRYLDTWEVVDPLQSDLSNQRRLMQCGQVVIPMPITHSRRRGKNATEYHQIQFLDNFRSFWAHLDMDRDDAFADFLPLFHHYVRFFSHRRTVQFMLLVTTYDIAVGIALAVLYPELPYMIACFDGAVKVVQITVYCLLVMYFNGHLLKQHAKQSQAQPIKTDAVLQSNGSAPVHQDTNTRQHVYLLDWYPTAKVYVLSSLHALHSLLQRGHGKQATTSRAELFSKKSTPFYQLINIGIKFLEHYQSTSNAATLRKIFNQTSYLCVLLYIFAVFPFYLVAFIYFSPIGSYKIHTKICSLAGPGPICSYFQWEFVLTLAYSTRVVTKYFFGSSIMLSLLGLAYAADIAVLMVRAWIARYSSFRKMDIFLQADEVPSEETAQQIDRLPAMSEGDQAVYNAIKRTYSEDKRTAEALPVDGDDTLPAATGAAVYQSLLKRDAYEHYLFMRTFIATACASWSPIVVGFLALVFFWSLYYLTYASVVGASNSVNAKLAVANVMTFLLVRLAVLVVMPIIFIANVNEYIFQLNELFKASSPGN